MGRRFGAFVFGGLVGAAAALLLAPRTGKETRVLVANKVEDLWGEGEKIYTQGRERVFDGVSQVQPVITKKNDELRDKIESARRAIAEQVARNAAAAKDAISDRIPVTAEKIEQAADVVRGKMDEAASRLRDVAAAVSSGGAAATAPAAVTAGDDVAADAGYAYSAADSGAKAQAGADPAAATAAPSAGEAMRSGAAASVGTAVSDAAVFGVRGTEGKSYAKSTSAFDTSDKK